MVEQQKEGKQGTAGMMHKTVKYTTSLSCTWPGFNHAIIAQATNFLESIMWVIPLLGCYNLKVCVLHYLVSMCTWVTESKANPKWGIISAVVTILYYHWVSVS